MASSHALEEYDPFADSLGHSPPARNCETTGEEVRAHLRQPSSDCSGGTYCELTVHACFAAKPLANPLPKYDAGQVPPSGVSTSIDPDLDELLEAYAQQAHAEVQKLEASLTKPTSRKAAAVRDIGLQTPIDVQNK